MVNSYPPFIAVVFIVSWWVQAIKIKGNDQKKLLSSFLPEIAGKTENSSPSFAKVKVLSQKNTGWHHCLGLHSALKVAAVVSQRMTSFRAIGLKLSIPWASSIRVRQSSSTEAPDSSSMAAKIIRTSLICRSYEPSVYIVTILGCLYVTCGCTLRLYWAHGWFVTSWSWSWQGIVIDTLTWFTTVRNAVFWTSSQIRPPLNAQ